MRYGYIVTAAHVVKEALEEQSKIEVQALRADGVPFPLVTVTDWRRPLADSIDLTLAPLGPRGPFGPGVLGRMVSVQMETQSFALNRELPLGGNVTYVGLLEQLEVPMVRKGTIGAVYQNGLRFKGGWNYTAHLVDCRSYGGFSGSPVYFEDHWTVLKNVFLGDDTEQLPLGRAHYVSSLMGMFTAHLDDRDLLEGDDGEPVQVNSRHGVGVVLPIEYVRAALADEELRMERKAHDEEAERNEPGLTDAKVSRRKPSERDEPVSLAPLTPEQALKGLLATGLEDDSDRTD